MTIPLSPTRFAALLDAYGAAPERWPQHEQAAALALIAADTAAQAAWERARQLDAVLDAWPSPAPASPVAAQRLLERLPPAASPQPARTVVPGFFSWRLATPAFALALVAGLVTGSWLTALRSTHSPDTGATMSTEGSPMNLSPTSALSREDWWPYAQLQGSAWTQLADTQ